MKSLPYLFLAFIALVLGTQQASAHAIWLESSAKATKGQAQEVRVYYGEYATGELEKIAAWYSDLKALEVIVVKPDQSEEKLTLQDKGDHFVSSFTPTEDGVYLIYTSHPTKDLGGKTRYEFTSQIAVQAGKSSAVAKSKLPYQLTVGTDAPKKGGKVALHVTHNGQPVKDQDVLLMSEAGWSKTFKTNAEGIALVDVLWSGKYVAEFGHSEEVKGTWHGQEYTATWQGLTTSFLVK